MIYTKCDDEFVLNTVKDLISKYHTDIATARVGVIWKEKASGDENNKVLATAHKVTDKQHACGVEYDFIIEIASDTWNGLDEKQRVALLFHELCHCGCETDEVSGEHKFIIIKHDLEEFRDVVERYGFWRDSLKKFADTCKNVEE